jgi:hypothetical protein
VYTFIIAFVGITYMNEIRINAQYGTHKYYSVIFFYIHLSVCHYHKTRISPAITHNYVQKVIQIYKRTLKL